MDTQPSQPGESGSDSSQLPGATSNALLIGTEQKRRHQLVHRDATNAATENMTQDAHWKIVHKTRCSKRKTQHTVGSEYIHNEVNGRQLTV